MDVLEDYRDYVTSTQLFYDARSDMKGKRQYARIMSTSETKLSTPQKPLICLQVGESMFRALISNGMAIFSALAEAYLPLNITAQIAGFTKMS